jgi:hypothetical protein
MQKMQKNLTINICLQMGNITHTGLWGRDGRSGTSAWLEPSFTTVMGQLNGRSFWWTFFICLSGYFLEASRRVPFATSSESLFWQQALMSHVNAPHSLNLDTEDTLTLTAYWHLNT